MIQSDLENSQYVKSYRQKNEEKSVKFSIFKDKNLISTHKLGIFYW